MMQIESKHHIMSLKYTQDSELRKTRCLQLSYQIHELLIARARSTNRQLVKIGNGMFSVFGMFGMFGNHGPLIFCTEVQLKY